MVMSMNTPTHTTICRYCKQSTDSTETSTANLAWPHLTAATWHAAAECVTDDRS